MPVICVIGGTSQRRRCASSASEKAIAKPIDDRDQRQLDVLDQRLLVAVQVVGDPARAEAVVLDAGRFGRAVADLQLGEDRDDHASASAAVTWASSSIESTPTALP